MSSTVEAHSHHLHLRQLNESLRDAQINPSIVIIIIILTIIFFLSGCLHLLIRCLVMRSPRRDPNSIVALTALQGQLQQLFHLHDSGVEQAFIDTLPVFFYKSVKGLKEGTGADCAVCLCEFEADDRLRLLPKCSHAFHMDCIDTWLLSHSTCPLCRRSLLPDDFAAAAAAAATSGHSQHVYGMNHNILISTSINNATDSNRSSVDLHHEAPASDTTEEQEAEADLNRRQSAVVASKNLYAGKVLSVQLGRLRAIEGSTPTDTGLSSSIMNGSGQRSYSVGSYEYVLNPYSLEVVIAPTPLYSAKRTPRRPNLNIPGHRTTLSECDPADQDLLQDPSVTPFAITGYMPRPAEFHQDGAQFHSGSARSMSDNVSFAAWASPSKAISAYTTQPSQLLFGSAGSSARSLEYNTGLSPSNRDNANLTISSSTQVTGSLHNLTCSSCTCSAVGDVLASATIPSIRPPIGNYQRLRPELDKHDKDDGNPLQSNSVSSHRSNNIDPHKSKHGENNQSVKSDQQKSSVKNSPRVSSDVSIEMPLDLSAHITIHHHQHQHLGFERDSAAVVRQAQSFRQPTNPDITKLRVSASRRSLSETDTSFGRGSVTWEDDQERSFSGVQLVSASTELSNPAAIVPSTTTNLSLARKTLNWLVGKH